MLDSKMPPNILVRILVPEPCTHALFGDLSYLKRFFRSCIERYDILIVGLLPYPHYLLSFLSGPSVFLTSFPWGPFLFSWILLDLS